GHGRAIGHADGDEGGGTGRAVADRVTEGGSAGKVGSWSEYDVRPDDGSHAVGRTDAGDRERIAVRITVIDQDWNRDRGVLGRGCAVVDSHGRAIGHADGDESGGAGRAVADRVT